MLIYRINDDDDDDDDDDLQDCLRINQMGMVKYHLCNTSAFNIIYET
jgi:hypothetical protein